MANEARNAVASIYDEILRSAKSPISIPDVLVRFVPEADVSKSALQLEGSRSPKPPRCCGAECRFVYEDEILFGAKMKMF